MKKKEPMFKPRSAGEAERMTVQTSGQADLQSSAVPNVHSAANDAAVAQCASGVQNTSQEQAAIEKAAIEQARKKREKKVGVISKVSAVWTLLSTLYAIASTCFFIAKGWVTHTVSIVLAVILAVYVIVFVVLAVMTVKDVKGGKKRIKNYKKALKIFKAVANIIFLSLTAVSMVGISVTGFKEIAKIVWFALSFAVAVIQLGLKISLLILKAVRVHISRRFKVEFVRYVNGKKTKKGVRTKLKERGYKEKVE